ncbi:MAG: serine/threonine protein kinase [Gemmatimonadetes bacterium]|nr:serine/threonine protein kinase [Gemmatimonadota bacterium]
MSDLRSRLNDALTGRYLLEREIGAGGMATVFLAHDLRHERDVALKVLDPDLAASIGAERFLTEIRTTARLQHPHILPLFDSGEADGFLFYVMPFVDGETLRDRLAREGQLPVDDALGIAREVADGLAYAHRAGVIHRDIKPANILLAGTHATLADFGIARSVERAGGERLTQTGTSIGTPTYMSPEQASAEASVDGRSDVYSLGCVLYEMLAGEPPYTGPTAASIFAKKVTQPPPSVRVVRDATPPWLEAVLARALAKAPADRFATTESFAAALSGPLPVSGGGSISSSTQATRTRPLYRRGMAVAAVAVLLIAAAWGILRMRGGPAAPGPGDANAIAVLPFTVRGGPELAYLREGMVDLLSTKLDGVAGIRTTDPQAVLATLSGEDTGGLSGEEISGASARLGAGRVIRGTVLTAGTQLHIQASVLDAAGVPTKVEASAEGPADDLFGLVDRLVSGLVASGITGGDAQLSDLGDLTTRSNQALRLYLDGIRNFRQGRGMQETTELLRRAVALDSTFALAAYWAGYMATYDDLPALADFELATRHREHLSPRAEMRLAAALAGAEGQHAEAIRLGRLFVDRYPDDVAGLFQLGEQISHTGYYVGDSAGAARPAYEHAVGLDPALAPAYFHLAVIGGLQADTGALDRWAAGLDSAAVDPIWPAILRTTRAGVSGDTVLLDRSVDTFLSEETLYPPTTLAGSIAELAASVMVSDPSASRRIMDRYARRTASDTARAVVTRRRARLESALGRFDLAEAALRSIGPVHRKLFPYDLAWVALHPAAEGGTRAKEAEELLAARTPSAGSDEAAVRRYLLARLSLKLGRAERFRAEVDTLRRESAVRTGDDGGLARDLVLELEALDAQLRGEPEQGLDSLLMSRYWTRQEVWPRIGPDTYFEGALADRWPQFLRAELLRQAGRDTDAALWYRISADGIWHRVIGLERLAEVAQEQGDSARAKVFYTQIERLWADADKDVQPLVAEIRGKIGS